MQREESEEGAARVALRATARVAAASEAMVRVQVAGAKQKVVAVRETVGV